jgi:hypothetical protein
MSSSGMPASYRSDTRFEAGHQGQGAAEVPTHVGRVHPSSGGRNEHQAGLGPPLPCRQPVLRLLDALGPECLDAAAWQRQCVRLDFWVLMSPVARTDRQTSR